MPADHEPTDTAPEPDLGQPVGRTSNTRYFAQGPRVLLEVRDNGVGIPAENLESVFDAFFSTRGGTEGTGLGLSISRQTMLEFGGGLTVESTEGQGSLFHAFLPAADDDGSRHPAGENPRSLTPAP